MGGKKGRQALLGNRTEHLHLSDKGNKCGGKVSGEGEWGGVGDKQLHRTRCSTGDEKCR